MNNKKIAVFFDCENISSKYVDDIFNELASYGEIHVRQAYMDWSSSYSKGWFKYISKFAIKPIQVPQNTVSKNAADLQIAIDVMKIMYTSHVDIIALVSSDSDFTSLAIEIKSQGFEVLGFGEKKTPESLRNAHSKFIELPIIDKSLCNEKNKLLSILKRAVNATKKENGYALVAQVGNYLRSINVSLNDENYGASTWGGIFRKYADYFEITYEDSRKSIMMVRSK